MLVDYFFVSYLSVIHCCWSYRNSASLGHDPSVELNIKRSIELVSCGYKKKEENVDNQRKHTWEKRRVTHRLDDATDQWIRMNAHLSVCVCLVVWWAFHGQPTKSHIDRSMSLAIRWSRSKGSFSFTRIFLMIGFLSIEWCHSHWLVQSKMISSNNQWSIRMNFSSSSFRNGSLKIEWERNGSGSFAWWFDSLENREKSSERKQNIFLHRFDDVSNLAH